MIVVHHRFVEYSVGEGAYYYDRDHLGRPHVLIRVRRTLAGRHTMGCVILRWRADIGAWCAGREELLEEVPDELLARLEEKLGLNDPTWWAA
jgi:hypothetical protein